jgi:hypothetical protein
MQQFEYALSAMIAKLPCHSAVFTTFLATPEVDHMMKIRAGIAKNYF